MDWACDHSDMRSVSHFQSFARTEPKSWNVSQFRLWNSGPLKAPGCSAFQLWPIGTAEPPLKPTVVTL